MTMMFIEQPLVLPGSEEEKNFKKKCIPDATSSQLILNCYLDF